MSMHAVSSLHNNRKLPGKALWNSYSENIVETLRNPKELLPVFPFKSYGDR